MSEERTLLEVADAVASGAAVDWTEVTRSHGHLRKKLAALQLVESIRTAHSNALSSERGQEGAGADHADETPGLERWPRPGQRSRRSFSSISRVACGASP